jgi:hypothetical protein
MDMKKDNVNLQPKVMLKFRYHCDSCSGRAFYGATPFVFATRPCACCGKTLEYKAENWLPVTYQPELDKINR